MAVNSHSAQSDTEGKPEALGYSRPCLELIILRQVAWSHN